MTPTQWAEFPVWMDAKKKKEAQDRAEREAANKYNWNLDMSQTTILKVADNEFDSITEKFPGLVFNSNNENKVSEKFQEIMKGLD